MKLVLERFVGISSLSLNPVTAKFLGSYLWVTFTSSDEANKCCGILCDL